MVTGRARPLSVVGAALAVVSLGSVWSSRPGIYLPGSCITNWDGTMTCTYGTVTAATFSSGFASPARVFVALVVVLVAVGWRRATPRPFLSGAGVAAIAGAAVNGSSWGSGHTLLVAAGVLLLVAGRMVPGTVRSPDPESTGRMVPGTIRSPARPA